MAHSFFLDDWRKEAPPRCKGIADAIKRGTKASREDAESLRKSQDVRFKKIFEEMETNK